MSSAPAPRAAGAILALTIVIGAVAGAIIDQPSAGVLAGTATGIAIALALWLRDRRHDER